MMDGFHNLNNCGSPDSLADCRECVRASFSSWASRDLDTMRSAVMCWLAYCLASDRLGAPPHKKNNYIIIGEEFVKITTIS